MLLIDDEKSEVFLNDLPKILEESNQHLLNSKFNLTIDPNFLEVFLSNYDFSSTANFNHASKVDKKIVNTPLKRKLDSVNKEDDEIMETNNNMEREGEGMVITQTQKFAKLENYDYANNEYFSIHIEEKHCKNGPFVPLPCERKNVMILTRKVNKFTIHPKGNWSSTLKIDLVKKSCPEYIDCALVKTEVVQRDASVQQIVLTKQKFEINYQSKRKEQHCKDGVSKKRSKEISPVIYELQITDPQNSNFKEEILIGIFRRLGESPSKRVNQILREYNKLRNEKFAVPMIVNLGKSVILKENSTTKTTKTTNTITSVVGVNNINHFPIAQKVDAMISPPIFPIQFPVRTM